MKIFVFGSNLAGRHGKGAAKFARLNHGAIYGQGIGLQGSSYGIPTKGHKLAVLSFTEIAGHVDVFLAFAAAHPDMQFNVTRIGCGLAGYRDDQIGPLFKHAPSNCVLPNEWHLWHRNPKE